MALPTWPAGIFEQPVREGYDEGYRPFVEQSTIERGPKHKRRRSTLENETLQASFVMTKAGVAILETFFNDTLSYGNLPFEWTHPRTGDTMRARFNAETGLKIRTRGDGYQVDFEIKTAAPEVA